VKKEQAVCNSKWKVMTECLYYHELQFVWSVVQLEQRRDPVGGSSATDSVAVVNGQAVADKSPVVLPDRCTS